jgi:hypothetical protein
MFRKEKEQCFSGCYESLTLKVLRSKRTIVFAILVGVAITGSASFLSEPAQAVPSFARQTGQPCGTCHTDFPGLTPYGRLFKLNGYTTGGGRFRTTLFPSWGDPTNALAAYAKKTNDLNTTLSGRQDTSNIYVPAIAAMEVYGFTHTQKDQPMGSPYHANDNANNVQLSFFYAGAMTDHIGLFSQLTYQTPYGGSAIDPSTGLPVFPSEPCNNCEWAWDNIDLRYANTGSLGKSPHGGLDFIYGITANNNPTVQDPWNTMPAWIFPYMVSNIADSCCTPATGGYTLLDGLAQLAGGVGAYVFIDNLVYLELSGYRTLDFKTLPKLGANPFDLPGQGVGVMPYWRAAVEPHWGKNWFEFGTFGMTGRFRPYTGQTTDGMFDPDNSYLIDQVFPQTDRYTDIGLDSQYQYQGDNYWVTLRGTYIHESQNFAASFANQLGPANPTDTLNSLKAYASLAYGNDNRIVLSGQYFDVWGSPDAGLYGAPDLNPNGSPNSNGWAAEIAYIPFISSKAPVWPWANVRIGLQYTYYNKFNGTTVNAHDNNSLFLYAWFAM